MPKDMYPEAAAENDSSEMPQDQDVEDQEGETALLPKSLFGGDCKVGDEYTVKVVGVLEDELEVAPVKKEEQKPERPKSRMEEAGSKLDSMGGMEE